MGIEQIIKRLEAIEDKLGIIRNERFKIVSPDEVLDTKTGFTWMRNLPDKPITWYKAMESYGGNYFWRMPTIQELFTLVDYTRLSPALPDWHPFMHLASFYWTSTEFADVTSYVWVLHIQSGSINQYERDNDFYVWPIKRKGA